MPDMMMQVCGIPMTVLIVVVLVWGVWDWLTRDGSEEFDDTLGDGQVPPW